MIYRDVPMIVGEDVYHQLVINDKRSNEPFVIFDRVNGKFVSLKLEPQGNAATQDILYKC